jgi:arginine/ornithine N-succinyltransferase beta subunit
VITRFSRILYLSGSYGWSGAGGGDFTGQTASGGYATAVRLEQEALRRAAERRKRELEEEEAAQAALEAQRAYFDAADGGPTVASETDRIEALLSQYALDDLSKEARRAYKYAQQKRTEAAIRIAEQAIRRQQEEEEVQVLTALLLHDD